MTDLNNTIQDKIDDDYKVAYKGRQKELYSALRFILSAIKQKTIDSRKELTNEEVLDVLRSELKKRKDAQQDFLKGNRQDLSDQMNYEITLIEKYLPAQMPDAELEMIVKEAIAAMGATSKEQAGKVMGSMMAKVKGKADGSRVKAMVESLLS